MAKYLVEGKDYEAETAEQAAMLWARQHFFSPDYADNDAIQVADASGTITYWSACDPFGCLQVSEVPPPTMSFVRAVKAAKAGDRVFLDIDDRTLTIDIGKNGDGIVYVSDHDSERDVYLKIKHVESPEWYKGERRS